MNFFCATVELEDRPGESIKIHGGQYVTAPAFINPGNTDDTRFTVRLLCYEHTCPKLEAFMKLEPGTRVLVGGVFKFSKQLNDRWDVIVHTLETNINPDTYVNHAMLGGAFLTRRPIKESGNGYSKLLGLDPGNEEETTLITMEIGESRLKKLEQIESAKGNQLSVCGHVRAWKPRDSDALYRFIRGVEFDGRSGSSATKDKPKVGSSVGQTSADEDPLEQWNSD